MLIMCTDTVTNPSSRSKDAKTVLMVLKKYIDRQSLDVSGSVLAIGAGELDVSLLCDLGFSKVTTSNIQGSDTALALDAENIELPDNSYDVVFAHAVLHHCRSPHKAVTEMARIARKHILFIEPNESSLMDLLVKMGFSFPYELAAVWDNGHVAGGMRNGPIPNFVYRWNKNELRKTLASGTPERQWTVCAYPYWDFFVSEFELAARKDTRLDMITRITGVKTFIRLLRFSQAALNLVPFVRKQGNKFLGAARKGDLQPWVESAGNEKYRMKKDGMQIARRAAS
jgi:SAM-dependent methyltransferase